MTFRRPRFQRRPLPVLLVAAVLLSGCASSDGPGHPGRDASVSSATATARQEIEYLRRNYAQATDLIGANTPEGVAKGRAIYRRIFTRDAAIAVTENGKVVRQATGPDEWAAVVAEALVEPFQATQHLIGTQIVEIHSLPSATNDGHGEATMSSYLQAWHDAPDGTLDVFIGTYHDNVRFTPGQGWQIYRMNLARVSGRIWQR